MQSTRIDIRHMRYALAVADLGGFRAAAKALNIAQPAVSKSVKDTELDLGFAIFERTASGVTPTASGRNFLDDARQAVAQFQRAIRASRRNAEGASGHIILGYSALASTMQMSPGLEKFLADNPGVQLEMQLLSTDTMMRRIRTGDIDIGFLLSHPSVSDPHVTQRPIWSTRIGVVAPRGQNKISLEALHDAPFIMGVRENWRSYRALLDAACAEAGLTPRVVDEVWDVQVIYQRVAAGRGLTFFPMSIADSLPASLEILPVEGFEAELSIAMAWSAAADTALIQSFRKAFIQP